MEIDRAAFTLIVRLQDAPAEPPEGWLDWRTAGERLAGGRDQPHKQFPSEGRHYFQPHIEGLLFPESDAHRAFAARWLTMPEAEELTLEGRVGAERRTFRLRVDLIERFVPPLKPRTDFGLVHLTLQGDAAPTSEELLRCNSWLRRVFRARPTDGPQLTASTRDPGRVVDNWPIRQWLAHLFGGDQPGIERLYYVTALAPEPADLDEWVSQVEDPTQIRQPAGEIWRRALTRGGLDPAGACRAIEQDAPRGRRPQVQLGPFSGFVLGRGCGLACASWQFNGEAIRNLRSYWADALMLALIQQTYLEHYAQRLGALGADPSLPDLDDLYDQWLAFRNLLWWSQPSDRDAPRELLLALRADLGGTALFDDLVADFDTYVARRQRRLADRQANALTNLQAFGAAGTLVAALAAASVFVGIDGSASPMAKTVVLLLLVLVFIGTVVAVQRGTREAD